MNALSAFDVLGPNMIGPSSSHTAGAAKIGFLAQKMMKEPIRKVRFTLYGSFARTYRGHGTDRALLGGVLGFSPDDERIRDAFDLARQRGMEVSFQTDTTTTDIHPNTADILMVDDKGEIMQVRGVSTGGGQCEIIAINDVGLRFTGEYTTLVVRQQDRPGVAAHITKVLGEEKINIAFIRLFREGPGEVAHTIVETDDPVGPDLLKKIENHPHIHRVLVVEK